MKLRLALAVAGGVLSTSSGPRAALFLGGKVREDWRKLMKEVFPEFLEPMTRTLFQGQLSGMVEKEQTHL